MTDTPPIKLYTALLAAMRDFGTVKKDRQNPAFRSSYATLHSILEAVEGPLNDHGLILIQRLADEGGLALITELIHAESGQSISSYASVICAEPNNPQKVGSAITYMRRYSLLTLLNLTPEEDDDGNAAAAPRQQPAQRPQQPHSNGSGNVRTIAPPAAQSAPQTPAPALAPDDPLADVLATLRSMETRREPWAAIKKYGDEQSALADDYGKQTITSTLHGIAARRKAAAPAAPAFAGVAG